MQVKKINITQEKKISKKGKGTLFEWKFDNGWVTLIPIEDDKKKDKHTSRRTVLTKKAQKDIEKQEAELEEMEKSDLYEISIDEWHDVWVCPFKPWRPVEYKTEYCEMMIKFFMRVKRRLQLIKTYYKPDHRLDGKDIAMLVTWEIVWPLKSVFPKEKTPMFPTFQRFCTDIGIVRSTLYDWMKRFPELNDTYNYCKELQHAILLEGTMLGLYKDNFTQFLLKNDFEYKDESELKVKTNTKDSEELNEAELMASLEEIRKKKALSSKKQ